MERGKKDRGGERRNKCEVNAVIVEKREKRGNGEEKLKK